MTFPEYFQEVQTLITKEIDLPFDCPFPDGWLNANNAKFSMFQYYGVTPERAVQMHLWNINQRASIMATRKKKKSKI